MKASLAAFGTSNAALRLPGALCGIGAVIAIWAALRRAAGPPVALLGAFMAALSPYQIHYSRDANHYGPSMLLAALTWLWLERCLSRRRAADFIFLAAILAIAYKTHPFNIFLAFGVLASFGAWAWSERQAIIGAAGKWFVKARKKEIQRGALTLQIFAAACALILPGLAGWRICGRAWSLLHHARGGGQTEGYALDFETLSRIAADLGGAFFDYRAGARIAGAAVALLALYGVITLLRRRPFTAIFAIILFIAPHVLLSTITFEHFFNTRYLAAQAPVWMAMAALGAFEIARLPCACIPRECNSPEAPAGYSPAFNARSSILLIVFLMLWGANTIPANVRLITRDRQPYEPAARALLRAAPPGAKVLCFPPWSKVALRICLDRMSVESSKRPRLFTSGQLGLDSFATLHRFAWLAWMETKPIYYYASYRKYDQRSWPEAWKWIRANSRVVFEQPSGYVEDYAKKDYSTGVYEFSFPGRLAAPFRKTALNCRVSPAGEKPWRARADAAVLESSEMGMEIRENGRAVQLEEGGLYANDKLLAWRPEKSLEGESPRMLVRLPEGPIALEWRAKEPPAIEDAETQSPAFSAFSPKAGIASANPAAPRNFEFILSPPRRAPIFLEGGMASDFGPFRYVLSMNRLSHRGILLAQGAWAGYAIEIPDSAPRTLECQAAAEPSALDADMEWDGRPLGRVRFEQGKLSKRSIPLNAAPGAHQLRIFSGSQPLARANPNGPKGAPVLYLAEIAILPADSSIRRNDSPTSPSSPLADDRLPIALPAALRATPIEAERSW